VTAPATPDPTVSPALEPVHDFARKLRQPGMLPRVVDYVAWQRSVREAQARGEAAPPMPAWAPLSINLDLTTACNFACDHCIDWDILNSGISHEDEPLRASLAHMAAHGMRSVILIGGGEPTVHPRFREIVRFLKGLGQQVAIVSNGSRNDRILDIVDVLDEQDWIRLSLDSGTDATFQTMHKPKKPITLEAICAGIPLIRARNPEPRIGFSYVIVWDGAQRAADAPKALENIEEMALAARLAREHGFSYISYKPMLTRAEDGAEVMSPDEAAQALDEVLRRIRAQLELAKLESRDDFAVIESTNLKLLESGTWNEWTNQPRTCHMQVLRQVLSPLGLWNCPAHRGVDKARIAGKAAFATQGDAAATTAATEGILETFDASTECREVTCLYNGVNWWIEKAIRGEGMWPPEEAVGEDHFL
jgi:wyosine [tRNA(Phe)-imidazoG37] synthetase (radical SAM superfamily)